MLSSLLAIILPTFGVIAVGVFARRIGIWAKQSVDGLNKYAYYIALPALIFTNIIALPRAELVSGKNLLMIGGTLGIHMLIAAAVMFFGWIFKISREHRAVSPMLTTFGSTAYLGIPFVTYLIGEKGAAYASLLSVVLVTVLIFIHTIVLNDLDKMPGTKNTFKSLAELPFLWTVLIGVAWVLFNLPALPLPLARFFDVLAQSAGPVALLGLGAFLYDVRPAQIPWGAAFLYAAIKVFVLPLLVFAALSWLGIDGIQLITAVSLSAVASGATCFVLAEEHRIGIKETGGTILVSMVFSFFALSFISYLWLQWH